MDIRCYRNINGNTVCRRVAALLRAEDNSLTNIQIQQALIENAFDIYDEGNDFLSGAGVVNGSIDVSNKVPEIIEFPSIALNNVRIDTETIQINVIAQEAKGVIDDEFSGDVLVNVDLLLSNPSGGFVWPTRNLYQEQPQLQTDYTIAEDEYENTITVSVYGGIGTVVPEFTISGNYLFSLNPDVSLENYILTKNNYYYPIRVHDVSLSGEIILDQPYEDELEILLLVLNQYNQIEYDLKFLSIPAGVTSIPYNLNPIRDTNYMLYYCLLSDNDTYYNCGFYKTADITALDPADCTLIDMLQDSHTGIDLNICTVPEQDDDISNTITGAEELLFWDLEPGIDYYDIFSLEYQGDRDYFTFEVTAENIYYFMAASGLARLQNYIIRHRSYYRKFKLNLIG